MYRRRFFCIFLIAIVLFTAAGCADTGNVVRKKSYGEMLRYETDFEQNAMPFWRTNVMYNECVTMIQREDGSVTGTLLLAPVKILEVRDVTLNKVYEEGKDYNWEEGSQTLLWKDGSSIPFFSQNDLSGRDETGNQIPAWGDTAAGWTEANPWDSLGRARFGDALFCVSEFYYEKQIAVTYEYQYEAWQGSVTEYQGELLPKTVAKLNSGEKIKLAIYGDSIFTGCDSSLLYGREPKQEYFFTLLKQAIAEKSGSKISLHNPSQGGKDSSWGAENAQKLVASKNPDLVIIGFGMNDGGKTGEAVASNVQSIIDTVKASNPDCEFIVVAPMVPNQQSGFLITQDQFPKALQALSGEGVAFVDMFSVHSDILKTKDFSSTSGNNVNHPNDWLIRLYAMNLISCLIKL